MAPPMTKSRSSPCSQDICSVTIVTQSAAMPTSGVLAGVFTVPSIPAAWHTTARRFAAIFRRPQRNVEATLALTPRPSSAYLAAG
jgi:hypothetical protein